MKILICLVLCLLIFAGCSPSHQSKSDQEESEQRLKDAYEKYKNGKMKLERFSEIK